MSKQVLKMKYHPAKKEVEFQRFQDGKEVVIRSDSVLRTKYMNKRGNFVLQDYGNEFFDDIADAFDGLETVDIEVTTTKLDFEDFSQMIEYYNEDGKCKINATLVAELPDMKQAFAEAVKCGKEAVAQLQYHNGQIFDFYHKEQNSSVKAKAENYREQIREEIANIKEKITSMSDNTVNLCFTGVYSAGKSALINAILGYKILPESIESKTAKMFRISSPKKGEKITICFELQGSYTELEWNNNTNSFDIVWGPNESDERKKIQEKIYQGNAEKWPCHTQIRELLGVINSSPVSSSEIRVYFPISLDNDSVQFTIYDTPGTDSNYEEHKKVLSHALNEQRQSILIFVTAPDKVEGSGNNMLLDQLKKTEKKNSKTSIDLGRSLFVINKADTITKDAREILQNQSIKYNNDDSFSIKLSDKKLFFTSAFYGYAAKAKQNNIATPTDESLLIAGNALLSNLGIPMSFCYKQDHCASSQIATKRLQDRCDKAVQAVGDDGAKKLWITSGMYALETEIREYGEKYASAVKAFAIINSVDKALTKLSDQTDSLQNSNQQRILQMEKDIIELRRTIDEEINAEYKKRLPSGELEQLPAEVRKRLKLDSITLQSDLIEKVLNKIDKLLLEHAHLFNGNKLKLFNENEIKTMQGLIESAIGDFIDEFSIARKELLTKERDSFMEAVQEAIARNGRISDSAKRQFKDISKPQISQVLFNGERIKNIQMTYKKEKKRFIWKTEYLNKDEFKKALEGELTGKARELREAFQHDYRESLAQLLNEISDRYEKNLEQYSLTMKAMIQDKEAMKRLGIKLGEAAQSLKECQVGLDNTIWKELKND